MNNIEYFENELLKLNNKLNNNEDLIKELQLDKEVLLKY